MIKAGDEDLARELIAEGGPLDLEMTDAYGSTALTLASRAGHLELCRALLRLRPGPAVLNAQNVFGSTALMCASASGHLDVASELLLLEGLDVNVRSQYGSSALSKAAEAGHSEIVLRLLARGAQIAPNKLGKTPAQLAEAKGHAHVLPVLEQAAARVAITPHRNPVNAPPPQPNPAQQPLIRARVCGLRAANFVCKLETAVQGPPSTVIAGRGELKGPLPVNELVLLRRDPSVPPAGWVIVEVCQPAAGAGNKPKQRCLHPRRPYDKKCVDCPDKRLGRAR
jgi:hypothetical protein